MTEPTTREAVLVRLPTVLTILFPGAPPRVELRAGTVAEAIDGLNERWPGMGDRIRDSSPAIRRHINIFVDGRRARLDTPLAPGMEVFVLTAISGG
ncbi:MoaD/ThiS family protein [Inquilinus sp. CA228]|uniref:MoaD/ThiS family protein n=1 Tax=Inquilinus sp. CA228 TaxID=3455609 RepID=UPI003F8D3952